jgi:hypothetical protein
MSFCDPCSKTLPISICTESITIGSISSANTAVKVYFRNVATGKIQSFEAVTTSGGTVTIEPPFNFARNHDYEVWVNLASDNSVEGKETISIGYDSQDCLLVSFVQAWDTSAGYPVNFTEQTLEIA